MENSQTEPGSSTRDVEYFKNEIRNSPEWYKSVRKKAKENGISVDSMITLDAQYMVEQEKSESK